MLAESSGSPPGLTNLAEAAGPLRVGCGSSYLVLQMSATVGIIDAREHAQVVRDTWSRRQGIAAGEGQINRGFGADLDLDGEATIQRGVKCLLTRAAGCRRRGVWTFQEALSDVQEEAEAAQQGKGVKRLRIGINTLDGILGDLWPGLDAVAARSGHGKTVLGMEIAEAVREQIEPGKHVQVYSLEMPNRDLVLRMYQSRTGISADSIRSGRVNETADSLMRVRAICSTCHSTSSTTPRCR